MDLQSEILELVEKAKEITLRRNGDAADGAMLLFTAGVHVCKTHSDVTEEVLGGAMVQSFRCAISTQKELFPNHLIN